MKLKNLLNESMLHQELSSLILQNEEFRKLSDGKQAEILTRIIRILTEYKKYASKK